MKKHNFREIKIWQEALVLVKEVYAFTSNLPKEEKYGITSQINRSAVSIPSNIAEGSGRTSNKEFIRFLEIAISSSYELETQLILSEQILIYLLKKLLKIYTRFKIESVDLCVKLKKELTAIIKF
ncbi:MAG: four helix bundle protein [Flavobacteriales bacterium]|nr:four helix bundle protein [Flavobacteriales bacterium]